MQAKRESLESQLNEALHSSEARSVIDAESKPVAQSIPNTAGGEMDSALVTKKLEEELLKRDALIEVCLS